MAQSSRAPQQRPTQAITSAQESENILFFPPAHRPSRTASWTLYLIGLAFVSVIVWMSRAQIDDIMQLRGKIIPSTPSLSLSHPTGGIVQQVLVKEGDQVNAGQALIKLDATSAREAYRSHIARYHQTHLQIARLKAQASQQPLQISAEIRQAYPDIVAEEQTRYQEAMQERSEIKEIAQRIIAQAEKEQAQWSARQQILEQRKKELEEQLSLQGGNLDAMKLHYKLSKAKQEFATIVEKMEKNTDLIQQTQAQIQQMDGQLYEDEKRELEKAIHERSSLKQILQASQQAIAHSYIRAPQAGKIERVLVTAPNTTVEAGQPLIRFLPQTEHLLIEAKVRPAHVNALKPDMDVVVRSSVDHQKRVGKIKEVSTVTLKDQLNQPYHKVIIQTEFLPSTSLFNGDTSVEIDIIAGQQSVVSYLVGPLKTKITQSF